MQGAPGRQRYDPARDPAIAAFVDREFSPFAEIRSSELAEMARTCRPEDRIAFIQIGSQGVSCLNADQLHPPRTLPTFLAMFQLVAARFPLPRVRFALNLLDEARVLVAPERDLRRVPEGTEYLDLVRRQGARPDAARHPAIFAPMPHALFHRPVPIFSVSKIPGLHQDILLPTINALQFALRPWWDSGTWATRQPRLYWRGSTTGGMLSLDSWRRFPRVQLVTAARRCRHCDMGISAVIQGDTATQQAIRATMEAEGLWSPREPFERNFAYRYLYDIEGNSFSSRLPQFLASNSVVCKVAPLWEEYYYYWLRPWEHYVPMDPDFLDLDARVEFCESRPDAMLAIARASTALVRRTLSVDFLAAVVAALLWRYRALCVS